MCGDGGSSAMPALRIVANLLEPLHMREAFERSMPACAAILAADPTPPSRFRGPYAVYALLLGDHRHVYVGHYTLSRVADRIEDHRAGRGAKITRELGVVAQWGYAVVETKEEALAVEKGFATQLRAQGYPASYGWYSFEAWQ